MLRLRAVLPLALLLAACGGRSTAAQTTSPPSPTPSIQPTFSPSPSPTLRAADSSEDCSSLEPVFSKFSGDAAVALKAPLPDPATFQALKRMIALTGIMDIFVGLYPADLAANGPWADGQTCLMRIAADDALLANLASGSLTGAANAYRLVAQYWPGATEAGEAANWLVGEGFPVPSPVPTT